MLKLHINPIVALDMIKIKDFISEDNPSVANEVINKLYNQFENIQRFPEIGGNLSKRVSFRTEYRYVVSNNYGILYKIEINISCSASYISCNTSHDHAAFNGDMVGEGAFINRFQNDILAHTRFGIGLGIAFITDSVNQNPEIHLQSTSICSASMIIFRLGTAMA